MKRIFLTMAALALSLSIASAQDSSLEFLGGYSMQPYSVKGDARSAAGVLNGGNAFLRYTYFFPGNFGVFAQIGSESAFGDEAAFFGTMNKADGEKYLYRFSDRSGYESSLNAYCIGIAYRWDAGIFRFTPRLSVGAGDFYGYDYSYERRSRNGDTGPEYHSVEPVGRTRSYDYLIDGGNQYYSPTPMLVSADFQVSMMSGGRFYLFVQPGVTFAPFRINVRSTGCGSIPRYSPENWAEALAYSDAAGLWKRNPESEVSTVGKSFISPFFHLSVGVGISFGQRNKK